MKTTRLFAGCTLRDNLSSDGNGGGACLYLGGTLSGCDVIGNDGSDRGCGVCLYSGAVVTNCTIRDNRSSTYGGGVYCSRDTLVRHCTLSGNRAYRGGGAYLAGNTAVVRDCTIRDNIATEGGGGAAFNYSGLLLNCLLTGNEAPYGGGAYPREGGTLVHCTVAGNRATYYGGGMDFWHGGALTNCIVWGNTAGDEGSNIYYYATLGTLDYTCYGADTNYAGTGNINGDPRFVDDTADDYSLMSNSPCLDTGAHLSPAVTSDLTGTARPLDGDWNGIAVPDMGVYERNPDAVDSDGDGAGDYSEWIAGTDRRDSNSCFRIDGIQHSDSHTVSFPCSTGRVYSLQYRASLRAEDWATVPDQNGIPADAGGNMSLTDTNAVGQRSYRVRVRQSPGGR
jgi:hypothetical protein